MKIHAYRIERQGPGQLHELLATIGALALEDRFFAGDGEALRLEEFDLRGDFFVADFAGPRAGHGPGKLSRRAPMVDIDLGDDENFAEDTAIAVHIPSGYAAVQYNHNGPRVKAIEKYLGAADDRNGQRTQYQFATCLRPDAHDRLRRYGFIQEIDFTIAIPGIAPGAADQGISVGNALNAPLPQGAQVISMQVRANAGGPLGQRDSLELVDDLLARGGDLLRAKIWGKEAEGRGRKRPINLLNEHLSQDVDIRRARGNRFGRPERWTALGQTLERWLANGQLQQ